MWRDSKYQAADGADAAPSAGGEGRANGEPSRAAGVAPGQDGGAEDTGTGLLLRQTILETNSPYQQGNRTPLGSSAYKVILSQISYTGMPVMNSDFSDVDLRDNK